MKRLHVFNIGIIAMIVALLLSCAPQSQDVTDQIKEANKSFVVAFNNGDAAAVAANYAGNAKLFPSNSDVVEGTEAIQNFWQGAMDMGVKEVFLTTIEATGCGNTAYEVGRYMLHAGDGTMIDQGKYIVIWKKIDGQWKLFNDIWNTNNPAPMVRAMEGDTVWVVMNHIKSEKVKQFEDFNFNYLEPAAAEFYPNMRNTVRTLKPVGPNKDGSWTYFYLMDPAVSPDGYDMMVPLTAKYGEEKAGEYLDMFTKCLKGGKQEWVVTTQTMW
jgi:ketosteroid isomerase-like protein